MRRRTSLVVTEKLREPVEADAHVLQYKGIVRDSVAVVPYLLEARIMSVGYREGLARGQSTYEEAVVHALQRIEADLRAVLRIVRRPLLLRRATPYEARPL